MDPHVIVVALDDSPAAQAALDLALRLGATDGAELVLVHASPRIAESVFEENPLTREEQEEIEADPVLGAGVRRAREAGVEAHARLVGESGADAIADAVIGIAASTEATLIVLGSRGRGALAESMLGSVSRSVAHRSTVPVAVVHVPAV